MELSSTFSIQFFYTIVYSKKTPCSNSMKSFSNIWFCICKAKLLSIANKKLSLKAYMTQTGVSIHFYTDVRFVFVYNQHCKNVLTVFCMCLFIRKYVLEFVCYSCKRYLWMF